MMDVRGNLVYMHASYLYFITSYCRYLTVVLLLLGHYNYNDSALYTNEVVFQKAITSRA